MIQPHVSRQVGRFSFRSEPRDEANIRVLFHLNGKDYEISDTVDVGSNYDFDPSDMDISEVVDLIEKAINRYWISTDREAKRERIALYRANEKTIRRDWLLSQAAKFQREAARSHRTFRSFMHDFECLEDNANV